MIITKNTAVATLLIAPEYGQADEAVLLPLETNVIKNE